MPPVNPAVSAGVIALSVAVAAAIAVYESPELRRLAEDLRRRVAIALHSLGDNVAPGERDGEPVFNRPEDAEGFLQSRGAAGAAAEHGVVADEETRRRQREELMYWNSLHNEKKEQALKEAAELLSRQGSRRGSSFDDFLKQDQDQDAEKGAFVFNSGTDVRDDEGLVRRRAQGVRGLNASVYANPFGDEYGIDANEAAEDEGSRLIAPEQHERMSDIYSATEPDVASKTQANNTAAIGEVLFDAADETRTESSRTLERELGPDEYMTAGQTDRDDDAYTSIQAWAQNSSNMGFYSPLPATPSEPFSEPELISDGMLTPTTDAASFAGSGEDVANDTISESGNQGTRYYDVVSDDEDNGIMTPTSWSEVGSVVSESEAGHARAPVPAS